MALVTLGLPGNLITLISSINNQPTDRYHAPWINGKTYRRCTGIIVSQAVAGFLQDERLLGLAENLPLP